jgi:hypothetical protein
MNERRLSLAILLAVVAIQAVALAPELSPTVVRQADAASHFTLIEGMVDAVRQGGNPLDFWSPEISFGFPIVRTYQILAHALVALAYFALGQSVALATLYAWASYLAILALPVALYCCLQLLEFPALTSAAAVLLLPLIAGPGVGQLGMELRSWLRFGVFPQCVATSLLLLAFGLSWRAVRTGRSIVLAGTAVGLTMLAHLVYGWMAALSVFLMALLPDTKIARRPRIVRTLQIGVVAGLLSGFQLLPILQDGYLINRSRIEPVEKYDSHGATKVLQWLFTGRILDNDRLPAISLLALAGAALLLWRYRTTRRIAAAERFTLAAALFWILVFFGRPTWGVLLVLLGVTPDLQLHRVISGVQIFLLILAAIALAEFWRQAARRWHFAVAIAATVVALLPAALERTSYLAGWKENLERDVAGLAADGRDLNGALDLLKQRGGRAYAGLPAGWGPDFYVGGTPVYAFLSTAQVPAVSFPYNASALPTDIMLRFNERDPAHYRLFNVRSVLAPTNSRPPEFLQPEPAIGRFQVLRAPGAGYFGVVDVNDARPVTRETFFDLADSWLRGGAFAQGRYIRLDFHGEPATDLPPAQAWNSPPGSVIAEGRTAQRYAATVESSRPAFVLFRMTWHPGWKVLVDGTPVKSAMLTPGFLGAPITQGRHEVVCRYDPGNNKLWLALAGFAVTIALGAIERRRNLSKFPPST